ncbi:hypothetical protein FQN52_005505 [Onygenales sp. PD_12]|nr:hypothetical protein FQN52_005505 [Onygenales sp. PD_12]KAK2785608.1 hypothetical protein FQN51_003787 [Onygenales sp. PD_10]
MQKALRRAALAAKQAKRKEKLQAAQDNRDKLRSYFRERQRYEQVFFDQAKTERANRREDWMRGPLAPKRDSALREGVYGTLSVMVSQSPALPREDRRKLINFAVGDRVVVIRGREKGKIGRIVGLDAKSETVKIDGVATVDLEYPAFALANEPDKRPFRPFNLPFKIDDIRLILPIHPVTGEVGDTIVEHMYGGEPYIERPYGSDSPRHTRFISGLDQALLWPEGVVPDHQDEPVDTLRIDVENKTHLPSIEVYPMPPEFIDELRNKYSKFRTKHDPEWVAQKLEEDRQAEERRNGKLVTPRTLYMEKKAEEKAQTRRKDEDGNYVLPRSTAEYVAEFMAKKKVEN